MPFRLWHNQCLRFPQSLAYRRECVAEMRLCNKHLNEALKLAEHLRCLANETVEKNGGEREDEAALILWKCADIIRQRALQERTRHIEGKMWATEENDTERGPEDA